MYYNVPRGACTEQSRSVTWALAKSRAER